MAVKLGADTAMAAADGAMQTVNAGLGDATLVVYDGTEPAAPADAITDQIALITFLLPNPAFASAIDSVAGGRAVLEEVTPVPADAAGTASWFRLIDGNDRCILQGTVTASGGGGDLTISSITLVQGIEVSVVSFAYVQPKS